FQHLLSIMLLFSLVFATLISFSTALPRNSCAGFECPTGKRCDLQILSCTSHPCVPAPTCVVNITACTLPCPNGQSCVWENVVCKKEPCNPIQMCKQDQPGFKKSCDGIYCRRDMQCELRKPAIESNSALIPVCVHRPKSSLPIPMGTMPPSVTCDTLGCPPGERCVQVKGGPRCEKVECGYAEEYDRCFDGCENTCDNFGPVRNKNRTAKMLLCICYLGASAQTRTIQ
ncbi:hypothetical protein PMAYCL1PPCAC_22036, partial [Pristionchus mayeri]